jgi:hypothetical protein
MDCTYPSTPEPSGWGRKKLRPYTPLTLTAAAIRMWALWGSPLQGLRVSFDAAAIRMGAQKIAPVQTDSRQL